MFTTTLIFVYTSMMKVSWGRAFCLFALLSESIDTLLLHTFYEQEKTVGFVVPSLENVKEHA